jgi:uridine phosphorylase
MLEKETELILNANLSVYHLHLRAEHIADTVLLVGDPGRVDRISSFFETIEHKIHNREFMTHTGWYNGKRITALSTGIGTDNLDIVINELDAAVNMDPISKLPNKNLRQLDLIRLGTCGALQADLDVGSIAVSEYSVGLDGVKHFYDISSTEAEKSIESAFISHLNAPENHNKPYVVAADKELLNLFSEVGALGMTVTANGFFGPQGRVLRIPLSHPEMNDRLTSFSLNQLRIINYEMESSALYALGRALGHRCLCMCVVIGNRLAGKFSKDYHPAIGKLIKTTLNSCTS